MSPETGKAVIVEKRVIFRTWAGKAGKHFFLTENLLAMGLLSQLFQMVDFRSFNFLK